MASIAGPLFILVFITFVYPPLVLFVSFIIGSQTDKKEDSPGWTLGLSIFSSVGILILVKFVKYFAYFIPSGLVNIPIPFIPSGLVNISWFLIFLFGMIAFYLGVYVPGILIPFLAKVFRKYLEEPLSRTLQ